MRQGELFVKRCGMPAFKRGTRGWSRTPDRDCQWRRQIVPDGGDHKEPRRGRRFVGRRRARRVEISNRQDAGRAGSHSRDVGAKTNAGRSGADQSFGGGGRASESRRDAVDRLREEVCRPGHCRPGEGESDAARVSAAVAILDRGYGRPPQSVEATSKDGGPIQTSYISCIKCENKPGVC